MEQCAGCRHPLCAVLPEQARRELCRNARPFDVPAGTDLVIADFSNEIILLREGCAFGGVFRSGREKGIVTTLSKPGDVVNIVRLQMSRRPRDAHWNNDHWGIVVADVRGCAVPSLLVDRLAEEHHAFALALLVLALEKYSATLELGSMMSALSGVERVRWLDDLLKEVGSSVFELTHDRIGRIVGMNRVSVTRAMGEYTKSSARP